MDPRTMLNFHFRYSETPGVSEQRDETVQLSIDSDFTDNLDSIPFQPAIVVVELQPARKPNHPVKNPARNHFVPGIEAAPLPAVDKIEPDFKLTKQTRYFGRIVLQVCIERDNEIAAHRCKSCAQSCCLSKISAKADAPHSRIAPGQLCDFVPTSVLRAIITNDHF